MKITKITVNPKSASKVDLFVDGEPFATIDTELVLKLRLNQDKELDIETVDQIFSCQKINEAFNKCLTLLSKSLKTKKQVITYLKEKQYDNNTINTVIEKLENINVLNDEYYAQKFIESTQNKKGKKAIKMALLQKGVNKEIIDEELNKITSQEDTINYLAEKYLKNKPMDLKTIQKLNRFLLSKGFSYSEVNEYIGKLNYENRD